MSLTKADLLKGSREPEEVEIEGIEGKVLLRTLTDGEYQFARNITLKAITAAADLESVQKQMKERKEKGGAATMEGMTINFDVGRFTEAEFEAKVYVVACALSAKETWSVTDVKKLGPPGIVNKIAEEAYRISGITESMEDLVKSFRKD